MFELDNGTEGANAIDQSDINDADFSNPDDWARNNLSVPGQCRDREGILLDPQPNSCGYVAGPNVNPAAPGGSAFRSLFISDPNGASGDSVFAGGGSKDDLDVSQWKWKTSATSSDKTDLLPVGAAAYLNGDLLIYTFGTLFAPNGNATVGTWLFKNNIGLCGVSKPSGAPFGVGKEVVDPITKVPTFVCDAVQPPNLHENGDVLVQSNNTNGGRNVEMRVFKWVGNFATLAEKQADCSPGTVINGTLCLVAADKAAACTGGLKLDSFCGNMNLDGFPTESPDDWGYQAKLPLNNFPPVPTVTNPAGTDGIGSDDFPPTTLFEAGFNFSKLFPKEVGCFNTFLMNTRASQSVDAVQEDFASGKFPLCGISVDKTGDPLGKIGDPVEYTIKVTNTGAITLNRVSIVDTLLGDLAGTPKPGVVVTSSDCGATLAAGASCTITATRKVLASDPDPLPNTVKVVYSAGEDKQTAEDDHSVNLFQPAVAVDKTGDILGKIGDPVDYTIKVTNKGSADSPDLVKGSIVDSLLGDLLAANSFVTSSDCTATLKTGASCTIKATRTVLAGDPDPLPNTVTVLYNPEGFSNPITAKDDHSVNLFQPAVAVDKSGDLLSKVTDDVNYTFKVTNTSSPDSPTLVNGTIVDDVLGNLLDAANPYVTGSDCTSSLATGTSCTITATRKVLAGDPDPLPNTVKVNYNPKGFTNNIPASDKHVVELFQPSVAVDKSANCDPLTGVVAGAKITYSYKITNTSSTDSPDLNLAAAPNGVVDNKLGDLTALAAANGCSTLAATKSCSFTKEYTTTALDVGTVVNTVNVLYTPGTFPNKITASDKQECKVVAPDPALVVIEKVLLNTENIKFDYTDLNNGAAGGFSLLPLFVPTVAQYANSPFAAAGAGNSFATIPVEIVVKVDEIGKTGSYSVTEVLPLPPFVSLKSLQCLPGKDDADGKLAGVAYANAGATAQLTLASKDVAFCRYENLFNPGDEGCTPGFWKQDFHFGHWPQIPSVGYLPTQPLNTVFDFVFETPSGPPGARADVAAMGSESLIQALNYPDANKDTKLEDAAEILLRAAVAAVLNASSVQYAFTAAQVINEVNAALEDGSSADILDLATKLDTANNGIFNDINGGTESCPLSGQKFLN